MSLQAKNKEASKTKNGLEKINEEKKTEKAAFSAPFDLFGVSPKFYIDGGSKTRTWVGCMCSVLLIATIILLIVFQYILHIEKVESLVTSYESEVEGHELLSLGKVEQILNVIYYNMYASNTPFRSFIDFDFYFVIENVKTGLKTKRLIPHQPCEELGPEYANDVLINGKSACAKMDDSILIGKDTKTGNK